MQHTPIHFYKTFGKNPTGKYLELIKKSTNYRYGNFQNITPTSMMAKDISFRKVLRQYIKNIQGTYPKKRIPSVKTDLHALDDEPCVVWFGHSSYLLHIDGKNILVDPVFSGYASPVWFTTKSFPGSNIYTPEEMPQIDVLVITHDHYDHMDYQTIRKLLDSKKVKTIITSLGVGSHLRFRGVNSDIINECDWGDEVDAHGMKYICASARHFSGRTLKRGKTLWSSFILQTKDLNIYIGGDSGYDKHFTEIGEKYGPFDLAFLECGQYNENRPYIHMMPEETAQAALDLKAKILIPVHRAKFALSLHPRNEPIERVLQKGQELEVTIATPMIGEKLIIGSASTSRNWWNI